MMMMNHQKLLQNPRKNKQKKNINHQMMPKKKEHSHKLNVNNNDY